MKRITLFILLALGAVAVQAQNITGKVVDAEGKALPGASVYWADTSVGVATDLEGNYSLYRVKENNALVASFLGYTNDTIRVENKQREVNFTLSEGVAVAAVVVEGGLGNYIRQDGLLKSENISFAGLCKMACCSLAESFENSASVTVGFSDAISGARQIKMLGLAGTYTQILDENRTIMRGLSAPYGLSYTPGMWLSSIQVSKGISSVTGGHEAITGQINLEHRKPTDEERMFLNIYLDTHLKPEINISTAQPVTKDKRLSTVVLAHASMDTMEHDGNGDGYRDMPMMRQFNIANRWLYQGIDGLQVRWGAKYLNDYRVGGQMGYNPKMRNDRYFNNGESWHDNWHKQNIYGSEVKNQEVNAYFKLGKPVGEAVYDKENNEELRSNIAFVIDYDFFDEDAYFGDDKSFLGHQHMTTANAMYAHYFTPQSSLISGVSASSRWVDERLKFATFIQEEGEATAPALRYESLHSIGAPRNESEAGIYTEYTYNIKNKLSVVAGLRYDYAFYFKKHLVTPRAHIKWNITPTTVFRASAGMGYRPTDIVTDNIGIMATGRRFNFLAIDRMEEALTAGGSFSQSFSTFAPNDLTVSVDYFYTRLFNTVVVDQERSPFSIDIYSNRGRSRTHTAQIDITWTPIKRFDIFATFRYTDSRYTINHNGAAVFVERPLVSRYKALINLQYATNMRKWTFDFTAQLNGPARIPTQTSNLKDASYSPIYPMLFAQVSRRIKKWEIYVGCENLLNYKQPNPIIAADTPYSTNFNSSLIWGPLMGAKAYVGVRFNLY